MAHAMMLLMHNCQQADHFSHQDPPVLRKEHPDLDEGAHHLNDRITRLTIQGDGTIKVATCINSIQGKCLMVDDLERYDMVRHQTIDVMHRSYAPQPFRFPLIT